MSCLTFHFEKWQFAEETFLSRLDCFYDFVGVGTQKPAPKISHADMLNWRRSLKVSVTPPPTIPQSSVFPKAMGAIVLWSYLMCLKSGPTREENNDLWPLCWVFIHWTRIAGRETKVCWCTWTDFCHKSLSSLSAPQTLSQAIVCSSSPWNSSLLPPLLLPLNSFILLHLPFP